MTQGNLKKSLLSEETEFDPQLLAANVIRRDRRRIWMLTVVCVVAWMAVVMIPWATILPMLAKVAEHATAPETPSRQATKPLEDAIRLGTIATFLSSIICMFVAAICTVSLVVYSRKATLRQINARLSEISLMLKGLAEKR